MVNYTPLTAGRPRATLVMYAVYILQSLKDQRYYIGSTDDLSKRLVRHNKGHVIATRHRRPFVVVYSEKYATRLEATRRELKIKSYKGGKAFQKLLTNS